MADDKPDESPLRTKIGSADVSVTLQGVEARAATGGVEPEARVSLQGVAAGAIAGEFKPQIAPHVLAPPPNFSEWQQTSLRRPFNPAVYAPAGLNSATPNAIVLNEGVFNVPFGEGVFNEANDALSRHQQIIAVLRNDPNTVRQAATELAAAFRAEIERLQLTTPNDPVRLEHQSVVIDYLNLSTSSFLEIANALEQREATDKVDEKAVFIGRAAKAVEILQHESLGFYERNRDRVFDGAFRVTLFIAGATFLHAVGADGNFALASLGAVLGLPKLGKD